jgi:hypothetical protein
VPPPPAPTDRPCHVFHASVRSSVTFTWKLPGQAEEPVFCGLRVIVVIKRGSGERTFRNFGGGEGEARAKAAWENTFAYIVGDAPGRQVEQLSKFDSSWDVTVTCCPAGFVRGNVDLDGAVSLATASVLSGKDVVPDVAVCLSLWPNGKVVSVMPPETAAGEEELSRLLDAADPSRYIVAPGMEVPNMNLAFPLVVVTSAEELYSNGIQGFNATVHGGKQHSRYQASTLKRMLVAGGAPEPATRVKRDLIALYAAQQQTERTAQINQINTWRANAGDRLHVTQDWPAVRA